MPNSVLTTLSDTYFGSATADTVFGLSGSDYISGGFGFDTLFGGNGNDALFSNSASNLGGDVGSGAETLFGGTGNDALTGDENIDILFGGSGTDSLFGGAGADTLYGGFGIDSLRGGANADLLYGGAGFDTAVYESDVTGVKINLQNGSVSGGDANGDLLFGIEGIDGTNVADTLVGNDSTRNVLAGRNGADTITAGNYSPIFGDPFAEFGGDTLYGGGGDDNLFGAAGDSVSILPGGGSDVIDGGTGQNRVLSYEDIAGTSLAVDIAARTTSKGAGGVIGTDAFTRIDVFVGGGADDTFYGSDSDDIVNGGGGRDTFYSDLGADTINGGVNTDLIDYSNSPTAVTIDLANGAAEAGGHAQGDLLISVEDVIGTALDDTITGSANQNKIFGADGNDLIDGDGNIDELYGGGGDDTIYGGPGGGGRDTLYGGSGGDTLYGRPGEDVLYGGEHDDTLFGGVDDDVLRGDAGNDVLFGGENEDTLFGGTGTDTVRGDSARDVIFGATGNDILYGGCQGDTLYGGLNRDEVFGGSGADTLYGGDGHDGGLGFSGGLFGGSGVDAIFGGSGADAIGYDGADTTVRGGDADAFLDTLLGTTAQDVIYMDNARFHNGDQASLSAQGEFEVVELGGGNDWLIGARPTDTLNDFTNGLTVFGGSGKDRVSMFGSGSDIFNGGSGNDTFWGGAGNDSFDGGVGNDQFYAGKGADVAVDGAGHDIYYIGYKEGSLTLTGNSEGTASANDAIVLWWGQSNGNTYFGFDPSEVTATYDDGDGTVTISGSAAGDANITTVVLGQGAVFVIELHDVSATPGQSQSGGWPAEVPYNYHWDPSARGGLGAYVDSNDVEL